MYIFYMNLCNTMLNRMGLKKLENNLWNGAQEFDLTQTVGTWEHSTFVNNRGQNISPDDMLALVTKVGIPERYADDIILDVKLRFN